DKVDLILDGGSPSVGVESTVLDLTGPEIVLLRPGGCPVEEIERRTGEKVLLAGGAANRSPGTRYRHYAPLVPLLIAGEEGVRERVIAQKGRVAWVGMASPETFFGRGIVPGKYTIGFSTPENYARGLFSALRTLEASGAQIIAAEWPEEKGIGRALRDRLYRASREEDRNPPRATPRSS
ncbi:MAG: threonylcarbamoyl-AMP synthase, partial [Synergistaceae bacterium]|nr:threonylcarbamoyl-AMP synthase [Synergistaceae bacterium]